MSAIYYPLFCIYPMAIPLHAFERTRQNRSEETSEPQYNQQQRYMPLALPDIRAWPVQLKTDSAARQNIPSALHLALKRGDGIEAYKCVRSRRFSVVEGKQNNLILAIRHCPQQKELLKILIGRATRKEINQSCKTNALIEAAKVLDNDLVESLLKKKVIPNLSTPFEQTPLSCAIRFGGRTLGRDGGELEYLKTQIQERAPKMLSVVQTLLLYGASVDLVDSLGKTPLHYLCNEFFDEDVNLQLVTYLIGKGADPERVSWETPRSFEFMAKLNEAIDEGMVLNVSRLRELAELYEKATATNI